MVPEIVITEGVLFLLLFLIGFAVMRARARQAWISSTPARPVAQASTGRVALHGTVVAGDRGTGMSFGGKPCVVWNATIFDECNGPSNDDEKLASIDDKRAFWLEDGSGDRAWIVPDGCSTRAQATQHGSFPGIRAGRGDVVPNVVTEMTPRVLEWTRQHYQPIGASHITVDETAIGPGDVVYVLGRAEREPGGRLRLAHGPGKDSELLISTLSPARLKAASGAQDVAMIVVGCLLFVLTQLVLFCVWWLS